VTNGNPRLVVTVEYPPTEMATPEDKDNFYESLQTHTSNNIKCHNAHLVLGDFNVRLGYDSHKEAPMTVGPILPHDKTNNNGDRLCR